MQGIKRPKIRLHRNPKIKQIGDRVYLIDKKGVLWLACFKYPQGAMVMAKFGRPSRFEYRFDVAMAILVIEGNQRPTNTSGYRIEGVNYRWRKGYVMSKKKKRKHGIL